MSGRSNPVWGIPATDMRFSSEEFHAGFLLDLGMQIRCIVNALAGMRCRTQCGFARPSRCFQVDFEGTRKEESSGANSAGGPSA
jgi:hypothetical protein